MDDGRVIDLNSRKRNRVEDFLNSIASLTLDEGGCKDADKIFVLAVKSAKNGEEGVRIETLSLHIPQAELVGLLAIASHCAIEEVFL